MKKIKGVLYYVNEEDIELLNKKPTKFWKGVKSIGDSAFNGCDTLKEIKIPNSVTKIGDYAFVGCSNLTDIKIPDSVMTIGNQSFKEVQELEIREKKYSW